MKIINDQLIIRAIEPEDNPMLLELINDPETEYMLGGWSFPVSRPRQAEWTANQENEENTLRCTIECDNTAIGVVILSNIDYKNGTAEVHIKILKKYKGKGYGTNAIKTIVKYAFDELRLNCVYARISEHNKPSLRMFKKCRFEQEGTLRKRLYKRGQYLDVIPMSILKNEQENI